MTECYFTPKKDTTSATICANCGLEKMLHTIGEGINASKVVIITDTKTDYPPTFEWSDEDIIDKFGMDDEDDFQPCDNCDLPDACADFGCAVKAGLHKPNDW